MDDPTSSSVAVADSSAPADPAPRWSRRRRRIVLGVAVVLVVAAATTAALVYRNWKNTAAYLDPYFNINLSGPGSVGRTMYYGADIQPIVGARHGYRSLELRHVTPDVTVNTARAQIVLLLCPVKDPNMGFGSATTTSVCARTSAFRPGTYDLGFPATEIIYKITPTQPGTVRIEGADVSYCGSGRCGDQHAGDGILMHVHVPSRKH